MVSSYSHRHKFSEISIDQKTEYKARRSYFDNTGFTQKDFKKHSRSVLNRQAGDNANQLFVLTRLMRIEVLNTNIASTLAHF